MKGVPFNASALVLSAVYYYYFASRAEFEKLKEDGAFLESVQYGENYYGTSAAAVGAVIDEQRKVCLIDINLDSVLEVK